LWLNEGFATLFEYYVPYLLYPQYGFDGDFRTACLQSSLRSDFITNSGAVPMDYYVEEQTAIRGRFNYVSYQKAGTVLMKFQEALGATIFFKGLTNYLTTNFYQAASPAELYKGIQDSYDEVNENGGLDIASLMGSWATQAGYPIVSIEKWFIDDEGTTTEAITTTVATTEAITITTPGGASSVVFSQGWTLVFFLCIFVLIFTYCAYLHIFCIQEIACSR
jgi:aminopeptidase N